jgi:hypothetical protein
MSVRGGDKVFHWSGGMSRLLLKIARQARPFGEAMLAWSAVQELR